MVPIKDDIRPFPDALEQKCVKYRLVAGVVAVAVCSGAILCREPRILFFLFVPVYLVYTSLSLQREWNSGKIEEIPVYCSSVRLSAVRDRFTVSFCADSTDAQAAYYQFTLPNRKAADTLIPASPYTIYFRTTEPRNLLAYSLGSSSTSDQT